MITIYNDFHGSTVNLRASIGDDLSPAQIRRARNALCGISGCLCGGPLNERGPQEVDVYQTQDHLGRFGVRITEQ